MAGDFFIIIQLWQNAIRQLFAQLNAPLVKGEDIQDRALSEDFVLVQRNQRTRLNGVISRSRMELVGRLPSNTLNGTTWSSVAGSLPRSRYSCSTTSRDLPKASASVWAKKLDSSFGW